jgi:hypothetical protein
VNLEVEGTEWLVALTGPSGGIYPHAVALEQAEDFRTWRLAVGGDAGLLDGTIWIQGQAGKVVVDLRQARRWTPRTWPSIVRLRGAHRACVMRLADIQNSSGCDLRMDILGRHGRPTTALGASLCRAVLALGKAAQACGSAPESDFSPEGGSRRCNSKALTTVWQATAALVGLGAGLTPSGDDFLCGFLAAARTCDPGLIEGTHELINVLNDAVEKNIQQTTRISAFMVRCATRNLWPMPLVDLAEALAGECEPEALKALCELCGLGHSSGSDIATGFLFGLETLALESWTR